MHKSDFFQKIEDLRKRCFESGNFSTNQLMRYDFQAFKLRAQHTFNTLEDRESSSGFENLSLTFYVYSLL